MTFDVVLYEPEIPPNTGNIMRLCANAGARLHLIEPLGFALDDARLRRAGLDYREFADVRVHRDLAACRRMLSGTLYAASTRGARLHSAVPWRPGDALLFGPETRGLPQALLDSLPPETRIRIPMRAEVRSLNLANAVAVVLYEALRQLDFPGLS